MSGLNIVSGIDVVLFLGHPLVEVFLQLRFFLKETSKATVMNGSKSKKENTVHVQYNCRKIHPELVL